MFIHDDFLLSNDAAQRLYHEYAAPQPIIDYHNHLPPHDIASNRQYADLAEMWLEEDHYKWRAMRANGVDERFITGDASGREKFDAWAATMPMALRNPLYHWTHLELKRYFGVDELLNADSAERIWDTANQALQGMTPRSILEQFNVVALCTTDDPADDLAAHQAIAASDCRTAVFPAFRPDRALQIDQIDVWTDWCDRLAAAADIETGSFQGFLDALDARHAFFHEVGCRLSDHDVQVLLPEAFDQHGATRVYEAARLGQAPKPEEHLKFAGFMMGYFAALDAKRGWTKQLHIGALRNVNSRQRATLGPDTGFDTIGDAVSASSLAQMIDLWDAEGNLPQLILYNNNPSNTWMFAAMTGSFQGEGRPGKVQYGASWWYLDQPQGIRDQLDALSNCGLLSRFIGMLTDSRSFMSFPRHEYFRRIVCDVLGREIESGELPRDIPMIGDLVARICYANARDYLRLPLPAHCA